MAELITNYELTKAKNPEECIHHLCHIEGEGQGPTVQCSYQAGTAQACNVLLHTDCASDSRSVRLEDPHLSLCPKKEYHCFKHLPIDCMKTARFLYPPHYGCACSPIDQEPGDTACSFPHCNSMFHSKCMIGSSSTDTSDPDYIPSSKPQQFCIRHLPRSSQLVQRGCHPISYWNEFDMSRRSIIPGAPSQCEQTQFAFCRLLMENIITADDMKTRPSIAPSLIVKESSKLSEMKSKCHLDTHTGNLHYDSSKLWNQLGGKIFENVEG